MRVYISGPITGNPTYKRDFKIIEDLLVSQGHEVINPVKIAECYPYLKYGEYMKVDLALLEISDAIYMMDGWEESAGARLEYHYATTVWKDKIKVLHY